MTKGRFPHRQAGRWARRMRKTDADLAASHSQSFGALRALCEASGCEGLVHSPHVSHVLIPDCIQVRLCSHMYLCKIYVCIRLRQRGPQSCVEWLNKRVHSCVSSGTYLLKTRKNSLTSTANSARTTHLWSGEWRH